jgi:uncharacterized delta-60 repeat protein
MLRTSLLLCLVACGKVSDSSPDAGDDDPSKSIAVSIDPSPHYIRTGGRQTVPVALTRENVTGPVTVEVASPPAGVTIEPITMDGDVGELVIDAAADALFARNTLEVIASAGGETAMAPLAIEVIGQAGALDSTFGVEGVVTFAASDKVEAPVFAIAQGDRVVVGIAALRAGKSGVLVIRRLADGSPDPDFGISGAAGETFVDLSTIGITLLTTQVHAVPQPDGRIVIAGSGTNGNDDDPFVVRLTADGQLDPSLALRRLYTSSHQDSARSLAVGPSGEIVICGNRNSADALLVRLDSSGVLDVGFGSGGIKIHDEGANEYAVGVVVQRDGRIVTLIGNTLYQYALHRFGSDGQLDISFGAGGKAPVPTPDERVFAHALQSPDGLNLLVAGSASFVGIGELAVWRFLSDGRLDLEFAGGVGYWMSSAASDLEHFAIAPDGSLYGLASKAGSIEGPHELWIVHLDPMGTPDPAFGEAGIARHTVGLWPRAFALRNDHRLEVVGGPLNLNNDSDSVFTSYWH